jgi:AcrR family transcriptional regulator
MGRRGPKLRVDEGEILDAAEQVFSRHGYGETSLRMLIGETGISSTAFYTRYDSKEAVLAALVSRLLTDLLTVGRTIFGTVQTVEEVFERVPKAIVETVRGRKKIVRLTLTEGLAIPSVRPTLERAFGALAASIGRALEHQAAPGRLEVTASWEHMGWAMVGGVQAQIMRWAVFDLDEKELLRALQAAVRLPWSARPATPSAPKKKTRSR